MKRFISYIALAALLLSLQTGAFAMEYIQPAESGQLVFIDADNGLSYAADFYLSSVDGLSREGDSLCLAFDVGKIELKNFFSRDRESRILMFSDGRSVSGEDFDAEGHFTGAYFDGAEGEKKNQLTRIEYAQDPEAFIDYKVRRDSAGLTVLRDGAAVYGEIKQKCAEKFAELYGNTDYRPEICLSNSFFLRENEDGTLTAVRQEAEMADGYSVVSTDPEAVCVISTQTTAAYAPGRARLSYSNALGETVASVSFKTEQSDEGLTVTSLCPCCGEDTHGEIHLTACGHYICAPDYDESHQTAECGIAGHCCASGTEHGVCRNCRGFLCDGKPHGAGECQHVHQWFVTSYIPPSAAGPGSSVSTCLTCGQTLNETVGFG